ncbi:putative reverse transcriptase domain-containing protein, partial [Tanacetum coccineum]
LDSRYEIEKSSTARPTEGRGVAYGFVSTVDAEARQQGISKVGYDIRDTWVDPAEADSEIAPITVGEVNTRVIKLAELHEHDTQDLYALLEDAQDSRTRISQQEEVYASREAWAHSVGLSQAVHYELQTYREQVYAHESQIQAHQTQLQLQGTLIQTQYQAIRNGLCKEVVLKHIVISKEVGRMGSIPKTLDETIELANDLMDQKLRTYAERKTDNKRKANDSFRNNHEMPQCNKVGPLCPRTYRSSGNTNDMLNSEWAMGQIHQGESGICFECGAPGHFKRDCPKLKNNDGGNGSAQCWVYALDVKEGKGIAIKKNDPEL